MALSKDRLAFFLGVNTGFVTNGTPDRRYVEFYARRSSPALHCAIIGNVVVPGGFGSNASTPIMGPDPIWSTVAREIDLGGSLPGVQLATAWEGYRGVRRFFSADGGEVIEHARALVRSIDRATTQRLLDSFEAAAQMSIDHGYRHVQVHAAHGYLPSRLVDDRINPGAAAFRDGLALFAERLGSMGVESSIRVSMRTGDHAFDAAGSRDFMGAISALPFDFVDLSSGFYNIDKRLIYPARPEILAERHDESASVAATHPDRDFIVSGRVFDVAGTMPGNAHIGLCRDLIANPRFLEEPGKGCRNHGKCHYYSRGASHVTCPQWAEV